MSWTVLAPPFRQADSREYLARHVRTLIRARRADQAAESADSLIGELRVKFVDAVRENRSKDRQMLLAAGLVLTDLAVQNWGLRVRGGAVEVSPPVAVVGDQLAEKARIKGQELVKRDAQLREPSVRQFVRSMEARRLVDGRWVSIFSLMRDGRELAEDLRALRALSGERVSESLAKVVDPYLEIVREGARCPFTGLRLMDVWRYFRHTWTNQHTSVPGRCMVFLVRDRAAPCHPIVGIGALSSPVVQMRERDSWIGWHPETFLAHVRRMPTTELAMWLCGVVDRAIREIYVLDLVEDGLISSRDLREPTDDVIDRLLAEGRKQRLLHHRYSRARDHKQVRPRSSTGAHWVTRARTHLFRSKRALALADFLRARRLVDRHFGRHPSAEKLAKLVDSSAGRDVVRRILRKARADAIGIAVADISVCGAVQPYNAILGGKLVSMLATSPEVVLEYRRRYSNAQSEIASAMAGRPVVRPANLVLLSTTSLYGVGSSQYNRVKIPCEAIGGTEDQAIKFERLGHSEAFGTSQYAEETVDALVLLVEQSANGQRVNSIFGEGVSPKLRKVREGLEHLGFPSSVLLRHHRRRLVYVVSLVKNLRKYLLGMSNEPEYLIPVERGAGASSEIAAWWRERWLLMRVDSEDVLQEISRHSLVRPVRHGARVPLDVDDSEDDSFSGESEGWPTAMREERS